MPTLVLTNFNIVCAVLGGFITLFGLVSYLCKERFYLSEALISLVAGVIFSPHAANFIRPLEYAQGVSENLDTITLYFTRLVLGVQLVLAGVQLPSRYLYTEWKPLALLLGPGMTIMWISASLLVWAMVPHLPILHALAIGACVTPTDPVLSNSIVKGKFADKNIPKPLQKIIIAESGANDGLGYPFLFLALYLIKYTQDGGAGQPGGAAKAMGYWFGETWGYTILLSVVYGFAVGWLAKELLHFAEERKYVDRESFLVFAITLALFITGTCGMIGSDDVLACFVAGNAFTWDDWFRLETADDSLQPTIDMLLNISVFLWFGAVCPWASFRSNDFIPIYRLIFLGILILLLRRVPIVLAMHKKIQEIEHLQQAIFVGFFGPIGVSAIFYLYVSVDFLNQVTVDGVVREDAERLAAIMRVVIWFLAICSIVVHGLSIPLGKLGYHFPRTISQALSSDREDDEPDIHLRRHQPNSPLRRRKKNNRGDHQPSPAVFKIGRSSTTQSSGRNGVVDDPAEPPRPIHFPVDTPPVGTQTPVEREVGERGQEIESSARDRPVTGDARSGLRWQDESTRE
ncbi:CPA1 family monovalent cation:H+ antiporter [Exophiala viscosa]|uniref:CPA1 family monovalent cation:H+ antiporter n=1 Tax=Exophiala viscosa TaxID=2486360 RepID=A0AAN6DZ51_9EURO|nr:CPA1 family monovalent cation:H+ antiporter [Exophiala viscosa]